MSKHLWTMSAAAVLAASTVAGIDSAAAQTRSGGTVVSTQANYSQSMDELMRAAQRLRESIQALATQQRGPERDRALLAAREALYETQHAMIQLPPELRQSKAPNEAQSMAHLKAASERLYGALHAMSKQPAGDRRNAAMRQANDALFETEYAIVWLMDAPARTSSSGDRRMGAHGARTSGTGLTATHAAQGSIGGPAVSGHPDAKHVMGSVDAVAGGVGVNSRDAMMAHAATDHNVKLVFALTSGNYLADVNVKVMNRGGNVVIDGVSDGPWLYAKLPPGSYTAQATYRGVTKTEKFTVPSKGQRTAMFRWPAALEERAVPGSAPILGTGPQNPNVQ